jgi:hypothetical protein
MLMFARHHLRDLLEEYCSRFALPPLVELGLVGLLFTCWLIAAVAFMLAKTNESIVEDTSSARKLLRALSWVLVALYGISALTTWRIARGEEIVLDDAFNPGSAPYDIERNARQYDTQYRAYS